MIGTLVRLGVTAGLEALGVEKGVAKFVGWTVGTTTTLLTLDVASAVLDASACVADGAASVSLDVATAHAQVHADVVASLKG